ncbi:MAG: SDR family NAD(P)-dependent oxidoreductase [Gammaproteobacteria bacterium]|jgi:NAD(P)-dependent dehydrogenase (short-subunit alcohol dehydrogenase family)|nr:SDR family NAD(P)-dependent oxidoreductase [Gammaproteobacteria bacterium]MBP6053735.1 SDR family NAD(P)-dependent oxidoreductase [Pseudomonadales bacterium]MBK7169503.1 SDR family NAD(P)-dependent oxidoreductase [Gammaproteobacteria bacterium]MBK7728464.1 SDR family NAD(P)-dependent oxidoreductase [Gammaproteobacteria bacterium]MBK9664483.1 SDR family NAD(P)-dependent oxidoreductase [Gammaproteobacteria bacterium]
MTQRLEGKVAIVTGASRGIGAALAIRLAAEGARVTLVARTVEEGSSRLPGSLNSVAGRIRDMGGECICIAANLAKEKERSHIVPETIARFGGVDILVNNAAWCRYQATHEQRLKDVRQTFEINVVAPLHLTQQAIPSMKERGAGWVVNLSSATVNLPDPAPYDFEKRYTMFNLHAGPSMYAATKACLERMTAGQAVELAQYNIAVNTLAPVEAVMSEGAIEIGTVDAGAHLEPEEAMAEACLELSSRPASELSGRILLSLDLLRELGMNTVRTLGGKEILPDYTF